jgi:hypothetical protein
MFKKVNESRVCMSVEICIKRQEIKNWILCYKPDGYAGVVELKNLMKDKRSMRNQKLQIG